MSPTVKKWLVRPLLIIFLSLGVLAGVGFIVISTQQQRIVDLAVAKLNKQFKGELSIEESEISLFKHFPYVSIVLHNGRFFANPSTSSIACI
jgi:hypothetical protein